MTHESVQVWLDNYVNAWRTYDASLIGDLFSDDALYFHHPFDSEVPVRGREAIVASWLEARDAPGSWDAHYAPIVVEGRLAVAQGQTRYFQSDGTLKRAFANLFVLHFDEAGRCERFTEWYIKAGG